MARRCFVIGPMHGDEQMESLHWLRDDVVQRLLPDFVVETPDMEKAGNVMDQVIHSCDRAELVVADTTGNNPNVLYEIAVLDAMGRACIPVRITGADVGEHDPEDRMAFDRAQYRVFNITRSDEDASRDLLKRAIDDVLKRRDLGEMVKNPLTDCFGVPLTEFTSATALANGYHQNFIRPTVKKLEALKRLELLSGGEPVGSGVGAWAREVKNRDPAARLQKRLDIVVPDTLDHASRSTVQSFVDDGILQVVEVEADGRPIKFYEWVVQPVGHVFHWLDIPTTMNVLRTNVDNRIGDDEQDPQVYRELELDEIGHFVRALRKAIKKDQDDAVRTMADAIEWPSAFDVSS